MRAPPLTPLAAAVLRVPVPERALVVGCGDGESVLFLAREFPAARIRGIDPSPELLRAARSRVGLDPEGRVAFKLGRPSKLPYPDGFFDLLIQFDGRPSPREVSRVLKPSAYLILINSQRPLGAAGVIERLLRGRLARRGITVLEEASAGDGNFFVARLLGGGSAASAI